MRKVLMTMFMTIDGRAQLPIYSGPPYTNEEDSIWKTLFDRIDTLILGRVTYTGWASFWPQRRDDPTASDWEKEFARFADRAEKIVFSTTLQESLWENTRIVRGKPAGEVARLRSLEGKDIAVCGGPRVAQSFLADDLIDEMLLVVAPSIVERGTPLFHTIDTPDGPGAWIPEGAPGRHDFVVREARAMKDANVFLRYERAPKPNAP